MERIHLYFTFRFNNNEIVNGLEWTGRVEIDCTRIPKPLGVYLDRPGGLLSFYEVSSDEMSLSVRMSVTITAGTIAQLKSRLCEE